MKKNKTITILLAFFLGGIGAHKLYLGKYTQFALYLVFCWTMIPMLISLLETLRYVFMTKIQWDFYTLDRG